MTQGDAQFLVMVLWQLQLFRLLQCICFGDWKLEITFRPAMKRLKKLSSWDLRCLPGRFKKREKETKKTSKYKQTNTTKIGTSKL